MVLTSLGKALVATLAMSVRGFYKNRNSRSASWSATHSTRHGCIGRSKRYCPCVVVTCTFLRVISALAKYRAPKLRLDKVRDDVLLERVGKKGMLIPRRFRELHPMVCTYEMLKINCTTK